MNYPNYKLIVAGGRDFTDYNLLNIELTNLLHSKLSDYNVSIVCGMARGADMLGHKYATECGLAVHEFPADWQKFGRRAGCLRNKTMGDFADGLLAFHDGVSSGTMGMIWYMESLNKPVIVINYKRFETSIG